MHKCSLHSNTHTNTHICMYNVCNCVCEAITSSYNDKAIKHFNNQREGIKFQSFPICKPSLPPLPLDSGVGSCPKTIKNGVESRRFLRGAARRGRGNSFQTINVRKTIDVASSQICEKAKFEANGQVITSQRERGGGRSDKLRTAKQFI